MEKAQHNTAVRNSRHTHTKKKKKGVRAAINDRAMALLPKSSFSIVIRLFIRKKKAKEEEEEEKKGMIKQNTSFSICSRVDFSAARGFLIHTHFT